MSVSRTVSRRCGSYLSAPGAGGGGVDSTGYDGWAGRGAFCSSSATGISYRTTERKSVKARKPTSIRKARSARCVHSTFSLMLASSSL